MKEEVLEEREVKEEAHLEEGLEDGEEKEEGDSEEVEEAEGDEDRGEEVSDDEMTPEELERHKADYEEFKKMAEEARRRVAEIKDEDTCLEYKKMIGLAPLSQEVKKEERVVRRDGEGVEEKEIVFYARCGECGVELPYDQLCDNGSYLVCKKCI